MNTTHPIFQRIMFTNFPKSAPRAHAKPTTVCCGVFAALCTSRKIYEKKNLKIK